MTTQIRLFEPFEPNAQRGVLKNCELCGTKFGAFSQEHQCKRCFRAVCSGCGTTKRDVYKPKMNRKPHRLCKQCNIQSTILIQYISINKLNYGQDSVVAKRWLDRLPTGKKDHLNIKAHKKFTIQIFNQLWDAYNFSLRQFIGLLTYTMGQNDVYKLVNTVYIQLQSRGVQQRMQNIILMIVFMLCFSGTDTCTQLVEYLYNLKKCVTDQKQFLLSYLKALGIEDSQSKKLVDYLNYKYKQYLGPYSINAVTTECSIHVISRSFQKNRIDETFMLLAITLQDNWDQLIKNRANKTQCDFLIIRNCNMSTYIDKFKQLVSVNVSQFSGVRANLRNSAQMQKQKSDKFEKLGIKFQPQKKQSYKISKSIQDINFKKKQSFTFSTQNGKLKQSSLKNFNIQINKESLDSSSNFKTQPPFFYQQNNKKDLDQESIDQDEVYKATLKKQNFKEQKVIKTKNQEDKPQKAMSTINKQINKSNQNFAGQNLFAQLLSLQQPKNNTKNTQKASNDEVMQENQISQQKQQIEIKLQRSPQKQSIPSQKALPCVECSTYKQKLKEIQQQNNRLIVQLNKAQKQIKDSKEEINQLKHSSQSQRKKFIQQLKIAQKSTSPQKQITSQDIKNLKNKIQQTEQRQLAIMKQASKYQKENKSLKTQVEQLRINNKILMQKLQQLNTSSIKTNPPIRNNNISININQNEQQISRINKMMEKTIQNKNKQLQMLTIKNKELIQRLNDYEKSTSSQSTIQNEKAKQLQKEKQNLMEKMKQLSEIVIKQQSQKLNLSQQLFQLRQIKRSQSLMIQSTQNKQKPNQMPQLMKARISQCAIF